MKRADRRRFEKEFKKLPKPDNCMICGTALVHNTRTFGGLVADGSVVLAGECCERHVVAPMVSGLYLTRGVDGLLLSANRGNGKNNIPEDLGRLDAIQSHFSDLDNRTLAMMRQGGIPAQAQNIFVANQPWKADDAAWFKNNPDRSHRLRPMLEGEEATLPPKITTKEIPANHRLEILVRQVEPGVRIRTIFCRNINFPLPDHEAIVHALFDTVSKPGSQGIIDPQKLNALAQQYAISSSGLRPKPTVN